MDILNPPGWPRPKGYSNGIAVSGRMVFVAGMVGWNANEEFETDDFAGQFRQALENICAVLAEGGAGPEHVVRMTVFLGDKREYLASLKAVGAAWREVMGRSYPAMALLEVADLLDEGALVEIQARAALP